MPSADNLCKQFGPRSGLTKLFDALMVFLKEIFKKVDFEKSADNTKARKNSQGQRVKVIKSSINYLVNEVHAKECLFEIIQYIPVNNFSVMSGPTPGLN